jgi:hypothetical protein
MKRSGFSTDPETAPKKPATGFGVSTSPPETAPTNPATGFGGFSSGGFPPKAVVQFPEEIKRVVGAFGCPKITEFMFRESVKLRFTLAERQKITRLVSSSLEVAQADLKLTGKMAGFTLFMDALTRSIPCVSVAATYVTLIKHFNYIISEETPNSEQIFTIMGKLAAIGAILSSKVQENK